MSFTKRLHKKFRRLMLVFLLSLIISATAMAVISNADYEQRTGIVSAEGWRLNVREGAGTGFRSLGLLNDGTEVNVTGEAPDDQGNLWYEIDYNGGKGYVFAYYIRFYDPDDIPITDLPVSDPYAEISFEDALVKEGFPDDYKAKLREIHRLYPNWYFKAMKTGYAFDYAVDHEKYSLVANSSISSWKAIDGGDYNYETGEYKGYDGPSWVRASRELIMSYMDPRNFLNASSVFQFLEQSFDAKFQSIDGVRQILKGTFMENDVVDADGENLNYAECIYAAGEKYNVNPYVLAAMIVQEQGSSGSSRLISGTVEGYTNIFNYFNVGAYDDGIRSAVERGLWYASQGSDSNPASNLRPWNTRRRAIEGGAYYYSSGYINKGQNTLYLKKFNVQGSNPFTHQYMTNVQGAAHEAIILYRGYSEEMKKTTLVFSIPVYDDMPESPCAAPTGTGSPNMKLKSISVGDHPLTPDFDTDTLEYTVIVPSDLEEVEIKAEPYDEKATVEGAGKVEIKTGMNDFELRVTAENGYLRVYLLHIATADDDESERAVFSEEYLFDGFYVVGLLPDTPVTVIEDTLMTEGLATVCTGEGDEKPDDEFIGTGDLIKVYVNNENEDLYGTFIAIVSGDVNGDGKVSVGDLIKVRNYNLDSVTFTEAQMKAANVNGDDKVNMGDLIKIRNYILGSAILGG